MYMDLVGKILYEIEVAVRVASYAYSNTMIVGGEDVFAMRRALEERGIGGLHVGRQRDIFARVVERAAGGAHAIERRLPRRGLMREVPARCHVRRMLVCRCRKPGINCQRLKPARNSFVVQVAEE